MRIPRSALAKSARKNINVFAASLITDINSKYITVDGLKAKYINHSLTLPGSYLNYSHFDETGIRMIGERSLIKNSVVEYSSGNGIVLGEGNIARGIIDTNTLKAERNVTRAEFILSVICGMHGEKRCGERLLWGLVVSNQWKESLVYINIAPKSKITSYNLQIFTSYELWTQVSLKLGLL